MKAGNIVLFFLFCIVTSSFTIPKPLVCGIPLYNNWDETTSIKKMDREYKKARRTRNPHNFQRDGDILFSKAYLNYLKTGAIDSIMFFSASENYKKDYSKNDRSRASKARIIYQVALCYYYEGNYKQADLWFIKYIKCGVTEYQCEPLYYAKSLLKQNLYGKADTVISNYCITFHINKDSIKALVDQDIKNGQ